MTHERYKTVPSSVIQTIKQARVENLRAGIRLDQSLSAPLPGCDRMSKLAEMAERARVLRAKHAARADAVVTLSADLEKRGDAALDGMERVVKEHEKDIVALEGELKQMTNGPDVGNASGSAAGSSNA